MGKETKKAPAAPKAPSAQPTKTTEIKPGICNPNSYVQGLDPNHQVELEKMMHERFYQDRDAAKKYNMTDEMVNGINEAVAIAMICTFANEVEIAQNPFAIRMRTSQLENIRQLAQNVGVSINMKALPQPEADGIIEIPSTAVEVSEPTKQKLREEATVANAATVDFDPLKIENDEQLTDALKQMMIKKQNLIEKIQCPIAFYRSVLINRAANEEEKKEIENMSEPELFSSMSRFLVSAPLVLTGIGSHMYTVTAGTKSPVCAFITLRNASKSKTTGKPTVSEQTIADYVKIIVNWVCNIRVAENTAKIEALKADIKTLEKNKKANAKGIEDAKAKIETAKSNINHIEEVRGYVNAPSSTVADEWPEKFTEKDSTANRIFGAIANSYYDEYNIKEMKIDGVKHNIQQYIGIITNLFLEAGTHMQNYSEANLVNLEPIVTTTQEEEKPEEKKEENESKKA